MQTHKWIDRKPCSDSVPQWFRVRMVSGVLMTQTFHCSSHSPSAALHTHTHVCACVLVCVQVCVCLTCLPFLYCNHRACSQASPGSQDSFFLSSRLPNVLMVICGTQPGVQYRFFSLNFPAWRRCGFHAWTHRVTHSQDIKWILKCVWTTRSFKV